MVCLAYSEQSVIFPCKYFISFLVNEISRYWGPPLKIGLAVLDCLGMAIGMPKPLLLGLI